MDIETRLSEFDSVPGFQCPAEFWPALGYNESESARYVAIWWERGGDEASWADGRDMVIGADWPAYQALMNHNFAFRRDEEISLGSSEEAAEFWLVIDRQVERAWMVPVEEAPQVLQLQWPLYEVAPLPSDSMVEWLAMLQREAARAASLATSMGDIEKRMEEGRQRYEALLVALKRRKATH